MILTPQTNTTYHVSNRMNNTYQQHHVVFPIFHSYHFNRIFYDLSLNVMENIQRTEILQDGEDAAPRLPSGFRVKSYLGREYIVLEFLDLTTEQAISAIHLKEQMNIGLDEVCVAAHNLLTVLILSPWPLLTCLPLTGILSCCRSPAL